MPGGGDPDNRRDFPGGWSGDKHDAFAAGGRSKEEQEVWAHVQKLLQLRAARADLRDPLRVCSAPTADSDGVTIVVPARFECIL